MNEIDHIPRAHFEAACRLFRLGLYEEAEEGFRTVLQQQRGNADAWNMLGIVLHRRGQTEAAVQALETAIDMAPRAPEALCNLGNLYKDVGDSATAKRYYRRALALAPDHLPVHTNLAACLADDAEFESAESHARRAIEIDVASIDAWSALTGVLGRRGDFERAIQVFEDGMKSFSDNADWHLQFGCIYAQAKRFERAIVELRHALRLRPGFVEAMNNLGHALFEIGWLDEAVDVLLSAIERKPDMKELHINLANVWTAMRRHEDALASFRHALALDPSNASAHFVMGMVLLVEGDFDNGWREYAWRWRTQEYGGRLGKLSMPMWHGEAVTSGDTLLVHAEQGHGDTLQFVRYLPLIRQGWKRVVFECQPSLSRLLKSADGFDQLIARGEAIPHADFHVPLLDLPGILETKLDSIPACVPYLRADAEMSKYWRERLDALGAGVRLGVAWAGNPGHANDRNRSMRLEQLEPLLMQEGVRWISLQKGDRAGEIRALPEAMQFIDWTDELNDFADTAALIQNLDLVIAVDTSVVHLAGALGKPAWVMIPHAPDWRWLLERSDSPWYPTLRLFRQSKRGEWEAVVSTVLQALKSFIHSASESEA